MYKRFLLVLIFFSLFIYANSIDLNLIKTEYSQNQIIEGEINLTINSEIDSSTIFEIKVDTKNKTMLFTETLTQYLKPYQVSSEEITGTNPQNSKTISKNEYFGIKLPTYAEIKSFKLDLKPSTSINSPKIDIGNDNTNDWIYVGDFTSWSDDFSSSPNMNTETISVNLDDNGTTTNFPLFCELVNLPASKYFQIYAKYKKVKDGDILKARISSFVNYAGNLETTGSIECTLPPGTSSFEWNSCDITSSLVLSGDYLLCTYSTNAHQDTFYQLKADSSSPSSGYKCPLASGSCSNPGGIDYFIKARKGNFNNVLSQTYQISETTPGIMSSKIQNYLQNCQTGTNECVVPLKFMADNSESLTFENLDIQYKDSTGSTYNYYSLYDARVTSEKIINIDGKNLSQTSFSMSIPISSLNLTAPNIKGNFYITIKLGTTTKKKQITIKGNETSSVQISNILSLINSKKLKINQIKISYPLIAKILNLENNLQKYQSFEDEYNQISSQNLSESEKSTKEQTLLDSINNYTKNAVNNVILQGNLSDIQVIEPHDITNEISKNPEQTYLLQNKVETKISAREYSVSFNSGSSEKYIIIEKKITPKEDLNSVYIYEEIPKSIASSVNHIKFDNTNFEIINSDPLVRFFFPSLKKGTTTTISYVVKSSLSQGAIYSLKTVLVPKNGIGEEYDYLCGDGICSIPYENEDLCPEDCEKTSKFPWIFFIIGVVVIVLGVFYFNYYKGKGDILSIRHRKTPFSNEKDLISVKNFINKSLNQKIDNKEISKTLMKKGWTKKQILFAFEDVEYDKRRTFTLSIAPKQTKDMKDLTEYIKKCINLKIKEDKIKAALYSKEWTKDEVNIGFSKVK